MNWDLKVSQLTSGGRMCTVFLTSGRRTYSNYIYISIYSIPFVSLLLPNRSFVITWCQWCQTTPMGPSWSGLVEIEARLPKLQFVHVFWGFMFRKSMLKTPPWIMSLKSLVGRFCCLQIAKVFSFRTHTLRCFFCSVTLLTGLIYPVGARMTLSSTFNFSEAWDRCFHGMMQLIRWKLKSDI